MCPGGLPVRIPPVQEKILSSMVHTSNSSAPLLGNLSLPTFESPILKKLLDLPGSRTVEVELSPEQPVRNLCHQYSHQDPEELASRKYYKVHGMLNGCAQFPAAGHRLRL